jgi:hypothetical protein
MEEPMAFLQEVKKHLDLPPADREQVLRELESHYREEEDELRASGLNDCEAATETARRMGDPKDLAQRIQSTHCQASWKTAFLVALPFVLYAFFVDLPRFLAIVYVSIAHTTVPRTWEIMARIFWMAMGIVPLAVSIPQLRAGRRPAWLPTWLAVGAAVSASVGTLFPMHWIAHGSMLGEPQEIAMVWFWPRLLTLLALGYCCAKLYRGALRIRSLLLLLAAIGAASITTVMWSEWGYLVSSSILLMACALRLFAWNEYGSPSQASLFLFAYYSVTMPVYGISPSDINAFQVLMCAGILICCMAALAFARAGNWLVKSIILSLGLIATLLNHWSDIVGMLHSVLGASGGGLNVVMVIYIVLIVWIVLVPIVLDRRRRIDMPEVVQ